MMQKTKFKDCLQKLLSCGQEHKVLCAREKSNTVETRNLEVPGTCKNNSKHPEIDSSESGFLHVIEIYYIYIYSTEDRI